MKQLLLQFLVVLYFSSVICTKIDTIELKCLVCKTAIMELDNVIKSIDPSSKINIGGYHLDKNGNYKSKEISKTKSEIHLSEIIDDICDKMENYVRATWKSNGTLTLLNLIDATGGMNAKMSEVDIIQDDDLNKSLQYYCSSIMEENEDVVIENFQNNNVEPICSNIGVCKSKPLKKSEL